MPTVGKAQASAKDMDAGFIIRSGPLMYTYQNYAKFFNGLPHPAFGYISGELAYLEIEYDLWPAP